MNKVIEICGLSYTYPDGNRALRNVALDVYEGETLGIIGPNGAGKTTLLFHMNGILRSDADITVLGMKMGGDTLREIRSRVGFVFQDPDDQLFSATVFDDVSFGPVNRGLPKDEVSRRVAGALAAMGIEGYGGRICHHLSSGEKKKAAVATVLSLPCEILVLDEPTSNLDRGARANLIALLKRLPQTKVIASHDHELIREMCDRVVALERGEIAAQTRPDEAGAGGVPASRDGRFPTVNRQ